MRIVESVHLHALLVIHSEIYYEIQCSGGRKKKKVESCNDSELLHPLQRSFGEFPR